MDLKAIIQILQILQIFAILPFTSPVPDGSIMYMPDNIPTKWKPKYKIPHDMNNKKQFNTNLETFSKRLLSELENANSEQNIIFSPFSIQVCLAMARTGACGRTAVELDEFFGLSASQPVKFAKRFHDILAPYENSPILTIANKMYIMRGYKVKKQFNKLLKNEFSSSIEPINFANSEESAWTINNWAKRWTNNLLGDVIAPGALSGDTQLVLINAIHFEAEWEKQFIRSLTKKQNFYLDDSNTVKVDMMFNEESYLYGEFPEYDAKALQLPYKNSNFYLLVFLPNSRTGLAALEKNLEGKTLSDLTKRMKDTMVKVSLPKFKAEFEIELSDILKNFGLSSMFSSKANFRRIVKTYSDFHVSQVKHKASIEFSEKGTEAAAATVFGALPISIPLYKAEEFTANKPFVYFLKDGDNIIFSGNVKKF